MFSPAFEKRNTNPYHYINVIQTINSDTSLLSGNKNGAHFIGASAYFYNGSSLVFSSAEYPSESLLTQDDPAKKISIRPPKVISIADDENGNPVSEVDLIFPGTAPGEGALLQYVDSEKNLQWVVGGVDSDTLTDLGLAAMSNAQLVTLVMGMRAALAELGKVVPLPAGTEPEDPDAGGGTGEAGGTGEIVIGP